MKLQSIPPAVLDTALTKGRFKGKKVIELPANYRDWILAQTNTVAELRRCDITLKGHPLSEMPFNKLRELANDEEITVWQKEIVDEWIKQRWPKSILGGKTELAPLAKSKSLIITVAGEEIDIAAMPVDALRQLALGPMKTQTRAVIHCLIEKQQPIANPLYKAYVVQTTINGKRGRVTITYWPIRKLKELLAQTKRKEAREKLETFILYRESLLSKSAAA